MLCTYMAGLFVVSFSRQIAAASLMTARGLYVAGQPAALASGMRGAHSVSERQPRGACSVLVLYWRDYLRYTADMPVRLCTGNTG